MDSLAYYDTTRSFQSYNSLWKALSTVFGRHVGDQGDAISELDEKKPKHNSSRCLLRGEKSIAEGTIESSGTTVLAKTFTGGQRWYSNAFHDSMAIARVKGKPALFLTKTLDVKCPEVQALLADGENPYDRPDILVRVFEIKRNEFMKLIVGENGAPGIFGNVVAYVAVVEFQKRGMYRTY